MHGAQLGTMEHNWAQRSIIGYNAWEDFRALLKSIVGNSKSIIGPGLLASS